MKNNNDILGKISPKFTVIGIIISIFSVLSIILAFKILFY